MTAELRGLDRYSGSWRKVVLSRDGAYVVLSVEATSGANEGEALLTPAQAGALAAGLQAQAELAVRASEMTGESDD